MAAISEFDLLNTPLEGVNLIEASAGTGKTYTITGLILRLILERGIPISECLVVTFTEAATSELKDRIRNRLREAAEAFSGAEAKDSFLSRLVQKYPERETALRRLNRAITDFDQASIFTIHGFCRRTLIDHAFASGILLDAELVTNEQPFIREIIRDFWRRNFYRTSPLFYNYARAKGFDLQGLGEITRSISGKPYLKVIPEEQVADCSDAETEFTRLFAATSRAWAKDREAVAKLLGTHQGLSKVKYKPGSIPFWVEDMDAYLSGECVNCTPCACFEKFTAEGLQSGTNKGKQPPSHPFFDLCEELGKARERLQAAYDRRILGHSVELVGYIRRELKSRKSKKNILFFDDLLVLLEQALSGPNGDHLAQMVRSKFGAALIDEFQDTDPIQYAIFDRIFASPGSVLFLIGDPKQAIYSFRGADIFTYMNASKKAGARFTLGENWRSAPRLISAVNALFSQSGNPFVYRDIEFKAAKPAEGKQHEILTLDGKPAAPLRIWYVRSGEKPVNKGPAVESLANSVAAEISRLLAMGAGGGALIGDRPLREGDIAVLVRKNSEAAVVQKKLAGLGVNSVLFKMGNLFKTHEAVEIARLLAAVADPKRERALKAAMATELIGASGEYLDGLALDGAGWDGWLERFGAYHDLWARYGFFRMFRTLLAREKALSRLMSLADGERRCTNVLHLSEVLHQAETEGNLSMGGLVKWLHAQMDENAPELEEHQLRLESDENAVKLVTIHKSKGLEYPVVFCPFAWEGSRVKDRHFTFHDEAQSGMPLVLDLGSEGRHANIALAEKESLAENLRLLYVALTRAKHLCYLAWGRIKDGETSAPAYLFHHDAPEAQEGEVVESLAAGVSALDDEKMLDGLEKIREKAPDAIRLSDLPEDSGLLPPPPGGPSPELACRDFRGRINRNWRISSFSSLVFNQPHRAELADRDETAPTEGETVKEATGERPPDRFSFPRGPAAGILLHDIFERLDFASRNDAELLEIVSAKLREYDFSPSWAEPVCGMVRNVLSVPLDSAFGKFRLSEVQKAERLVELEFHFPLENVNQRGLRDFLERDGRGSRGSSNLGRLGAQPLEGYMKGFIDLVFKANGRFYIVDWKSNYLGPTTAHYGRETLRKAVLDNLYDLQYTLYTVALHQYLKTRIPGYGYESHFGEVFYIFTRGVDPAGAPGYGVHADRPPRSTIEGLCSVLIGEKG